MKKMTSEVQEKNEVNNNGITPKKLSSIMDMTHLNYGNMIKRLSGKRRFSDFILPYYSIALIIFSLTALVYPKAINTTLTTYFSIVISIVVLVYSITNGQAHYGTRIQKAEKIMLSIKNLQREINDSNAEEKKKEYDVVMGNAEFRSDMDFFKSVKQRCGRKGLNWFKIKYSKKYCLQVEDKEFYYKMKEYLGEMNPLFLQMEIILSFLLNCVIVLIPIAILILCFKI